MKERFGEGLVNETNNCFMLYSCKYMNSGLRLLQICVSSVQWIMPTMDQIHFFIDAALHDIANAQTRNIDTGFDTQAFSAASADINIKTLKMPRFIWRGDVVRIVGGEMKGAAGKVELITLEENIVVLFMDVSGACFYGVKNEQSEVHFLSR